MLHVLVEVLLTISVVVGGALFFAACMALVAILIDRYGRPYRAS